MSSSMFSAYKRRGSTYEGTVHSFLLCGYCFVLFSLYFNEGFVKLLVTRTVSVSMCDMVN